MFGKHSNTFAFSIIPRREVGTYSWNPFWRTRLSHIVDTVGGRYNAIQYLAVSYTVPQGLDQNFSHSLNSQKAPHTLTGELWGVFCKDWGENWSRYKRTAL